MGFEFFSYYWFYPHLYRIRVNQPNCAITGFTVKLNQYGRAFTCELRYNDNSPSGFRGNPTGKPGDLVPQGDQFNLIPVDNGDGTYTFLSTAPSGVALPSQDVYWISLSLGAPGGSHMGMGWTASLPYDDVTLEALFIYYNDNYEQLGGRSPLIKILGCADQRTPSPSPTPSASQVSKTPSAPPTPSASASPLACGVKELTNTMSLSEFGWFSYYPQMHRLYVNKPACLLTAFTIKLQSYATLVLGELRYDTAGNNGADVKPGALVPQGDQFSSVPVNNGDGTYTFYTTARPGLYLNSQDYYWLVLSFSMNWDGYDGVVMGWSGTTANTNITVDWIFYTLQPGTIQPLSQRTAKLKLLGCCDLPPSVAPSPSPSPSASQVSSTPTPSFTPSAPPTTSPSPTVSFTASITPSSSPTVSFTPSITPSSSLTPSRTPSYSPSRSPTPSPSITPSSSPTPSSSASPSLSSSASPSSSSSASASSSPSTSPSPSSSSSPSASHSNSASPSRSLTPTASRTPSISATASASCSPTPSISTTPSRSPSPSITITPTVSPSNSPTPPPTTTTSVSLSPTPSISTSVSLSATPSTSATTDVSRSPTPSSTITTNVSPSTSPTPSPSTTTTVSPSATPSPSTTTAVSSSPTPSISTTTTVSLSATPSPSTTTIVSPSATPSVSTTVIVTPSISPSTSPTPSPSTTTAVSRSPTPSISTTTTVSLSATPSPSTTTIVSPSATPSISTTVIVTPSPTMSTTPSTSPSISTTPAHSMSNTPSPSISTTLSPSPSVSPTPSTSPFALPVAIASGEIYSNGQADVEVVTMSTSQTTADTQCAGNIVVGLSGTGTKFSYFIRLTGAAAAGTTTSVMAYVVDMSTGATLGQMDVTARMPTAANDSYTQVTAEVTPSSGLVASLSYWLPFCFTTTVTTRSLVARQDEGSIGIGGVSSSGDMTTVGVCSGGPSCTPTVQEGSLAIVISSTAKSDSGSDSGTIVAIAAGVAVPVALLVAGVVACVVAYIAYTRSKGRLSQLPPARRRSSVRHSALELEVQRLHENEMFEMGDLTKEQRRKLHRESWATS